jgi:hypothetical protein
VLSKLILIPIPQAVYGLYYALAYDIILVSTRVDLQEITIGCVKVHLTFAIPTTLHRENTNINRMHTYEKLKHISLTLYGFVSFIVCNRHRKLSG